jgi:DNA-binding protein HU-beta
LNKKEALALMSKEAGITAAQAEKAFNQLIQEMKASLRKGEKVTFSGFGSFEVKNTKKRKGRNPRTGEIIPIPAKKRIKFNPSKLFTGKL